MTKTEMTNDRAVVVLKCAEVALCVVLMGCGLFLQSLKPADIDSIPYGFVSIYTIVAISALLLVAMWRAHNALKGRMSDDAFSAWQKKFGWGLALFFALLSIFSYRDWERFATGELLSPAPLMVITLVLFLGADSLLKERMGADAFTKFNRIYQWAVVVVLVAAYAGYVAYRIYTDF